MTQLKQIYFKQNEKLEYEFFEDKECVKDFKFSKDCKNLYIELKNGDITPAIALDNKCSYNRIDGFTLYICGYVPLFASQTLTLVFLGDVECDYTKYIPKDYKVLFFNEWEDKWFYEATGNYGRLVDDDFTLELLRTSTKEIMLYTDELTSENIQKINNTAKMLKEKYGIEWVGVFTPFCFFDLYCCSGVFLKYCVDSGGGEIILSFINALITTNATGLGLLKPKDTEHLKVIDCKEIFEEYIKTN